MTWAAYFQTTQNKQQREKNSKWQDVNTRGTHVAFVRPFTRVARLLYERRAVRRTTGKCTEKSKTGHKNPSKIYPIA